MKDEGNEGKGGKGLSVIIFFVGFFFYYVCIV